MPLLDMCTPQQCTFHCDPSVLIAAGCGPVSCAGCRGCLVQAALAISQWSAGHSNIFVWHLLFLRPHASNGCGAGHRLASQSKGILVRLLLVSLTLLLLICYTSIQLCFDIVKVQ